MGQDEDDKAEAKRHNRGAHRDRVLKGGQITFGKLALDCIVLGISVSGARVSFSTPALIPQPVAPGRGGRNWA